MTHSMISRVFYSVIYQNKEYLFTGTDLDYVQGHTEEVPPGLTEEWAYMIEFARQQFTQEHRALHRQSMRGLLKVVR